MIEAEYDEEGVYFYQAFNDAIADWALEHQCLGGEEFKPARMTWIKPSFAWVLYRSGYASKHHQTRILKIKLSHATVAELLSECSCGHGGGGALGRVQWDPARDIMTSDGREPGKMMRTRAIQIGVRARLSELYVSRILSVEDVTDLAHRVGRAHLANTGSEQLMQELIKDLPDERAYTPACSDEVLTNLGMKEGPVAEAISKIGFGKTK